MSEFWLSGPVNDVPPLLLPAAHTFLQVRQDVEATVAGLSVEQLWQRVGQSAPIGFHAVHIAGATERILTYARGEALSEAQLTAARAEGGITGLDAAELTRRVHAAMDAALAQLRATPVEHLLVPREVGRKRLPATTIGALTHAAEHAYRHAGQIATLRRVLQSS